MARCLRPLRAWHLPEEAPSSTGQAAAVEAQVDGHLVLHLGALLLPILALGLPHFDDEGSAGLEVSAVQQKRQQRLPSG